MITAHGVLSAVSGGGLRPWHHASSVTERRKLVDRLLSPPDGHVLFYISDRPMGQNDDQQPAQQLKVVYRTGYGVSHFTNMDASHGPVGAWLARTDNPNQNAPRPIFDPWDPSRVSVPADTVLTIEQLREIASEYASTGTRSTRFDWVAVDFV